MLPSNGRCFNPGWDGRATFYKIVGGLCLPAPKAQSLSRTPGAGNFAMLQVLRILDCRLWKPFLVLSSPKSSPNHNKITPKHPRNVPETSPKHPRNIPEISPKHPRHIPKLVNKTLDYVVNSPEHVYYANPRATSLALDVNCNIRVRGGGPRTAS